MLKTLTLYCFIFARLSFAQLDSYVEAASRSYPSFGGATALNLGYNQALLGNIAPDNIWYSMARLNIEANTSFVVHHFDYSAAIYPLSFLAMGAGRKEMQSDYQEFSFYDCDDIRCSGDLNKDYIFYKIILSYNSVIFNYKYLKSRNTYDGDDSKPVAEYLSLTQVNPGDEKEISKQYFFGLKLSEDVWGYYTEFTEFTKSNQYSQMDLFIYNINRKPLSFTLGAGAFKSSEVDPGPIFIFNVKFEIKENLAIF